MLENFQSHREVSRRFSTLKQALFSSSLINEKRKFIISRLIAIPKNNNSRLINLSLYFSAFRVVKKNKKNEFNFSWTPLSFLVIFSYISLFLYLSLLDLAHEKIISIFPLASSQEFASVTIKLSLPFISYNPERNNSIL